MNKKHKQLNKKLNSIKSKTKFVSILLLMGFCMAVNQTLLMEFRVWGLILMMFSFIAIFLSSVAQDLISKELESIKTKKEDSLEASK